MIETLALSLLVGIVGGGSMVAAEWSQRVTTLPTRAQVRRDADRAIEYLRESADDDCPESWLGWVREVVWLALGPALVVRLCLHVGGAVVMRGGDPGDLEVSLRPRSPVLEAPQWTDFQLRVLTACYGLFWALMGTRALSAAGKVYFGVQVAVLVIDPVLWLWHWVLSPSGADTS